MSSVSLNGKSRNNISLSTVDVHHHGGSKSLQTLIRLLVPVVISPSLCDSIGD